MSELVSLCGDVVVDDADRVDRSISFVEIKDPQSLTGGLEMI